MSVLFIHLFPSFFVFTVSLIIAIHHYFKHRNDKRVQEESCAVCCYLQPSDMANHEIWVVCGLCIGLTWLISGWVFLGQCEYLGV
jgi:hypothetical protein